MRYINKITHVVIAWIKQNRESAFVMFLVFLALVSGLFLGIKRDRILEFGRFTRALILDCEANKSGFFMTVRYSVYGKMYEREIRPNGTCGTVGTYCFIKFDPDEPDDIVYMRELVFPLCLSTYPVPDSGWVKIPECR